MEIKIKNMIALTQCAMCANLLNITKAKINCNSCINIVPYRHRHWKLGYERILFYKTMRRKGK